MTRQRGLECTRIWMGRSIKETGKMISNLVRERKAGLTGLFMKEIMRMGRSMGLGFSNGLTAQSTKGTFLTTTLKDTVHTHGLITESMKDTGIRIRCMGQANFHGLMADFMKENT